MPHSRQSPSLALVAALTASLMPGAILAAEWAAEPSIKGRVEFDDNIRLTSANHDNVWGVILDPRLKLSRRTELWDLDANGRIRAADYTGQDGLNTVDNFFDITAKRRFERGSFDAKAALANDTTLQNEFLDLDTGLVVNQIDRTRRDLRLGASYLFTEATWLEAAIDYSNVEYDDGARYGLLNYDYTTPSLRLIYQLDTKTQIFGIYSHAKVDYDRSDELESNTDSLQLGGSYELSEIWNVSGSVGSRRTRTSSLIAVPRPGLEIFYPYIYDLVTRDSETTGLVYNASANRKFETGTLGLSASRSIIPSSTGTDTDTTSLTVDADRDFTAKLSARLAVSYFQSDTVGGTETQADRTRYRVAPSLAWKLDRDLILNTGYVYTHLDRSSIDSGSADSNAAFISLGYTWPRTAVSR